jgi:hypothetical protein
MSPRNPLSDVKNSIMNRPGTKSKMYKLEKELSKVDLETLFKGDKKR